MSITGKDCKKKKKTPENLVLVEMKNAIRCSKSTWKTLCDPLTVPYLQTEDY